MAAAPAGENEVLLGQSFDREIRSLTFQVDTDRPDLVMDWDLVQTATDTEPEAILLEGKIEGAFVSAPEIIFPSTGTPGFHRSLKLVFRELSTSQADAIGDLVVTVRFDQVEAEVRNLGGKRSNASLLMERAQSATNLGKLGEKMVSQASDLADAGKSTNAAELERSANNAGDN